MTILFHGRDVAQAFCVQSTNRTRYIICSLASSYRRVTQDLVSNVNHSPQPFWGGPGCFVVLPWLKLNQSIPSTCEYHNSQGRRQRQGQRQPTANEVRKEHSYTKRPSRNFPFLDQSEYLFFACFLVCIALAFGATINTQTTLTARCCLGLNSRQG